MKMKMQAGRRPMQLIRYISAQRTAHRVAHRPGDDRARVLRTLSEAMRAPGRTPSVLAAEIARVAQRRAVSRRGTRERCEGQT